MSAVFHVYQKYDWMKNDKIKMNYCPMSFETAKYVKDDSFLLSIFFPSVSQSIYTLTTKKTKKLRIKNVIPGSFPQSFAT